MFSGDPKRVLNYLSDEFQLLEMKINKFGTKEQSSIGIKINMLIVCIDALCNSFSYKSGTKNYK